MLELGGTHQRAGRRRLVTRRVARRSAGAEQERVGAVTLMSSPLLPLAWSRPAATGGLAIALTALVNMAVGLAQE